MGLLLVLALGVAISGSLSWGGCLVAISGSGTLGGGLAATSGSESWDGYFWFQRLGRLLGGYVSLLCFGWLFLVPILG